MLQRLRDNLKGTVAVIIIAIFAVPMVLFGVEKLFVGSLGGNDVASVEGETITRTDLRRAIAMQKQRILSQSEIDPSSDLLKDENLRGPVLQMLTRQAALLHAAREGGMAVSEKALWQEIVQQPQFQTDGAFDEQRFRRLLNNMGYTTATYLKALAEGVILDQQQQGIRTSSFLTEQQLEQLVAIAQQNRSYFSITIPRAKVADAVEVTEEEVASYYQENAERFRVPERVALNYVAMDLETLAQRQEVDEADIRAQYEQELATFDSTASYEVAHILIEKGGEAKAKVQEVQQALASGQTFAEVAEQYSEDFGTRENGGYLGQLVKDAYPAPFVEAVQGLEEGEVSAPVETDAGIHLIKVTQKSVPSVPSFAERKDVIEQQLRRSLAEQKLARIREQLDELTYSASNLQQAAEELGVEIQSTPMFPRNGGSGIAALPAVQEAAFSDEVLAEGHNSPVLELPGNRFVVVRVTDHEPAAVRPLDEVAEVVSEELKAKKMSAALNTIAAEIRAQIRQGAEARIVAEAAGYSYAEQQQVDRSTAEIDRKLLQTLFTMPRPAGDSPVLEQVALRNGDQVVLGLTEVQAGNANSLEDAQLKALQSQLASQQGDFEVQLYEGTVVSSADIALE